MTLYILDPYFWLFLALSSILVYFYRIYTYTSDFPTTPYLPIVGHLFDYLDPYETLPNLTNNIISHGGIIRQYIGPKRPLLMVGNKEFVQFLCANSKFITKGQAYRHLKPWLGDGLATSEGSKWLSKRRALSASLMQTTLLRVFVEDFNKKSKILVGILNNFENQPIDVHPFLRKFALDVLCENVMGVSLNLQQDSANLSYCKAIEILSETIQKRLVSFFNQYDFVYQFTELCRQEKMALAIANKTVEAIIDKNKLAGETKTTCMLDVLLDLNIDGKKLDFDDIRDEINTFTFAGHDTSSTALAFALYEIAQNPHVQEKLLKEQCQIFNGLKLTEATYENLLEMSYLEMVIKETMRLHTIVPCISKKITKELNFENKKIPAGLHVNVVLNAIHKNPDYFPDPGKFIPERFASKVDKFTYMPFGVKPRNCIGKNFAILEMKCLLSNLIRNFEVVKVPEHCLKLTARLVMFSVTGIVIKLKKRA